MNHQICRQRILHCMQHQHTAAWKKKTCLYYPLSFFSTETNNRPVTGHATTDKALNTITQGKIGGWMQMYEDAVGLTEVKEAQNNVMEAETNFLKAQENRRQMQHDLGVVQTRLKEISGEREKTNRVEQKYLELLQEEHMSIRKENDLQEEVKTLEKAERDQFSYLSAALRDSHEKERARAEKTKYWSIIGSVTGAVIGIVGTTINNYLRMRQLTKIVSGSAETSEEYKNLTNKCLEALQEQQSKQVSVVSQTDDVDKSQGVDRKVLSKETNKILNVIKQQQTNIDHQIKELRSVSSATISSQGDKSVVLIGQDVETLIRTSEEKQGKKMRLNTVLTVTLVYGALAVTIPIFYYLFKGA